MLLSELVQLKLNIGTSATKASGDDSLQYDSLQWRVSPKRTHLNEYYRAEDRVSPKRTHLNEYYRAEDRVSPQRTTLDKNYRAEERFSRAAHTQKEHGFTLLEVLFALFISAIFLITAMRFFTDQWRGARTLKNHLEAHYAVMTAGKTVSDAIRMAKTVEWVKDTAVLKVLPMPEEANLVPALDSYFIDDLDRDGIKDLYWKHMGISQPVASYITRWECLEVEPGLWDVLLEAIIDGQILTWRGVVRRRTYAPVSSASTGQPVMSAFLFSSF